MVFPTGGVLGGVPGGVVAPLPGYGGVPYGGASPGAFAAPGSLGGVIGAPFLPQPVNRVLRPYWFPAPYFAIPVLMNGGTYGRPYRTYPFSARGPQPVILYAPIGGGFYQPIVTFRGSP